MTELATFTILGVTVTRYALYALLGFLAPAALGAALAKRYGVRARAAVGFAVLAGVLGLLAGRLRGWLAACARAVRRARIWIAPCCPALRIMRSCASLNR